MDRKRPLGLGLVGCGAFGQFCLEAVSAIDSVRIAAVADTDASAAARTARRFGAVAYPDLRDLLDDGQVELVHIATPPASHYSQALSALRAGKHVLCEKPLGMDLREADEILATASSAGRICPVNFVLRYNDVVEAVGRVIESGLLGGVLAGRLTNCAFDTQLPQGHWFWNKAVSGGIFVEHGVHFFDLYRCWLGEGRVLSAHAQVRPGTGQEDRVTCLVGHDSGALVSHYHGFDQIKPMDRADHRLVCEMGDIRVDGWIALSLSVDAAVDEAGVRLLQECLPGCTVESTEMFGTTGPLMGRGRRRNVDRRVRIRYCPCDDKQAVYAESIRRLLADQVAFIRDPAHQRRLTEQSGRESLALAESARRLAGEKALR